MRRDCVRLKVTRIQSDFLAAHRSDTVESAVDSLLAEAVDRLCEERAGVRVFEHAANGRGVKPA